MCSGCLLFINMAVLITCTCFNIATVINVENNLRFIKVFKYSTPQLFVSSVERDVKKYDVFIVFTKLNKNRSYF